MWESSPADEAGDQRHTTSAPAGVPEITLDHVGTVENAAKVIAALHRGEKRLVFVDSRRRVEEPATALRFRGVTTFVSHSSLSATQRRSSEQAFAEASDCVIVATSTLELGIDVGDLDRVIQLGAPATVSSFLQRLGRTGRRTGSVRNCLFLGPNEESVLHAAGLLRCWNALRGLKFATALPEELAVDTLAQRHMDTTGSATVLGEPLRRVVIEE